MVLNLIALAVLAAAPVAAVLLMRRYLPATRASRDPVCLRCGQPAAALTSFTCPGCGHDVREAGLGRVRGRTPLGTFWLLVVFTCVYVCFAQPVLVLAVRSSPQVYRSSRNVSMHVSSPQVHGVELYLDAAGPDEFSAAGTITGELYASGGIVLLEAEVPSLRWRLTDPDGKVLDTGDRFDAVVYKWLGRAGVPVDSPVAHSDANQIANYLGQLARTRLELPPVPNARGPLGLSYSATSGGGSSTQPDPRWQHGLIIAATLMWILCVWLILLARRVRGPKGAAA
jgi:hypothetical protein